MPNMADVIIKKNDGTTSITYTGLVPSSGNDVPAVFKSMTVGSAPAHQPELRVLASDANGGDKRKVRGTYVYPQIATNSTTGVTSVVNSVFGDFTFNVPKAMAQTDINESAAQFGNLIASALIQACLKAGYAPT